MTVIVYIPGGVVAPMQQDRVEDALLPGVRKRLVGLRLQLKPVGDAMTSVTVSLRFPTLVTVTFFV